MRRFQLRRRLITAIAGAPLLSPIVPLADSDPFKKRLAVVALALDPAEASARKAELAAAFKPLGFREGENLEIQWFTYPNASSWPSTIREAARRAVAFRPDCILATGGPPQLKRVLPEAGRIPIVAMMAADPVRLGIAASHARPGGMVTGIHGGEMEVNIKRVQFLHAFTPRTTCIGWVAFAEQLDWYPVFEKAVIDAGLRARKLVIPLPRDVGLDGTIKTLKEGLAALKAEGCGSIHFHSGVPLIVDTVTRAALEHKIAVSYSGDFRQWRTEGLLFLYDAYVQAFGMTSEMRTAGIVARIFRGEHPGDIAFEGPLGYYLCLNERTATRIGLTIPPEIALQAKERER